MKKVILFFITENLANINDCLNHIHSIVANKSQAREYINKRVYMDNIQHFSMWCDYHERDVNDINDFYDYLNIRYKDNPDEHPFLKYRVIKMKYKISDLCSIIRQLSFFQPVNASYETQEEVDYYLETLKEEGNKNDIK